MKVYAIIRNWDNGLSYEDYEKYTATDLYSNLEEALNIYKTKTSDKYEGSVTLIEWEIDTNNKKTLQETEYIPCTPYDPWEEYNKELCYGDDEWEYEE